MVIRAQTLAGLFNVWIDRTLLSCWRVGDSPGWSGLKAPVCIFHLGIGQRHLIQSVKVWLWGLTWCFLQCSNYLQTMKMPISRGPIMNILSNSMESEDRFLWFLESSISLVGPYGYYLGYRSLTVSTARLVTVWTDRYYWLKRSGCWLWSFPQCGTSSRLERRPSKCCWTATWGWCWRQWLGGSTKWQLLKGYNSLAKQEGSWDTGVGGSDPKYFRCERKAWPLQWLFWKCMMRFCMW